MGTSRTLRLLALGIVLTLLCVPALTRVGQKLGPTDLPHQPTGFSKFGGAVPPDITIVLPDTAAVAWLMQATPPVRVPLPRIVDERLPDAPLDRDIRAPRPPPALDRL